MKQTPNPIKAMADSTTFARIRMAKLEWASQDSILHATGFLKPGDLPKELAVRAAISEFQQLGFVPDSLIFEAIHFPMNTAQFIALSRGHERGRLAQAKRWVGEKTFWRVVAGTPGFIDAAYDCYVDAHSGKVICVVPLMASIPSQWARRYDSLGVCETVAVN